MQVVTHSFRPRDLVAGHPVLDFINTVTARDTAVPLDWLDGYGRLLDWTALAGVTDAATLARLRALANENPGRALAALGRAKRLREALHDLFAALVGRDPVPADSLREVDGAWKKALRRSALRPVSGQVEPGFDATRSGLDLVADVHPWRPSSCSATSRPDARDCVAGRDAAGCSSTARRAVAASGATCRPAATSRRPAGTTSGTAATDGARSR